TYPVIAIISKPNYFDVTLTAVLTITPGRYDIENSDIIVDITSKLVYGESLPKLIEKDNKGEIIFKIGQTLIAGEHSYTWEFKPYNENYEIETGTISLVAEKASTKIEVQSTADISNIGLQLKAGIASLPADGVIVTFVASNGKTYSDSTSLKPGTYTVIFSYTGNENYMNTEYSTSITIPENSDNADYILFIVIGSVVGLISIISVVIIVSKRKKKS
ncbi:MAG: hypothetical protein LBU04_01000, partial [Christensenellaceae bacterium]|nr:hypothetical protein [Christensenellaceae bacterium]